MECTKKLEEVRGKRYKDLKAVKLRNIVDMALSFSAMMRLFEEGSKEKIQIEILERLPRFFEAGSETEFRSAHNDFCEWGIENIIRTDREKDGELVKEKGQPSYGQMAKTLDVVLHVVIHYTHQPDCEPAQTLSKWLNPAMDTKMMTFLAGCYPDVLKPWPKTIEQVGKAEYKAIQHTVRQFVKEEHKDKVLPVDFDDIYWEALNRKGKRLSAE